MYLFLLVKEFSVKVIKWSDRCILHQTLSLQYALYETIAWTRQKSAPASHSFFIPFCLILLPSLPVHCCAQLNRTPNSPVLKNLWKRWDFILLAGHHKFTSQQNGVKLTMFEREWWRSLCLCQPVNQSITSQSCAPVRSCIQKRVNSTWLESCIIGDCWLAGGDC